MRNQDSESFGFCEKIKNALNVKGYNNVFIETTIIRDSRFSDNPQADLEYEKKISIAIQKDPLSSQPYNYLRIVIPINTDK